MIEDILKKQYQKTTATEKKGERELRKATGSKQRNQFAYDKISATADLQSLAQNYQQNQNNKKKKKKSFFKLDEEENELILRKKYDLSTISQI